MKLPSTIKVMAALALSAAAFSTGHSTSAGNATTNSYSTSLVPVTFALTITSKVTNTPYSSSSVTNSSGVVTTTVQALSEKSVKFGNAEFLAALAASGLLNKDTNPAGWSIVTSFSPYFYPATKPEDGIETGSYYAVKGSNQVSLSNYINTGATPQLYSCSYSKTQTYNSNNVEISAPVTASYVYKGPIGLSLTVPSTNSTNNYYVSGLTEVKATTYNYILLNTNGITTYPESFIIPGAISATVSGGEEGGANSTLQGTLSFGASKAVIYTNSNIIQIP